MQTLRRTYMVVIKDYDHMTTMIETNTSIVKKNPLNLRAPFCTSTFTSNNLSRCTHQKKKEKKSPLCILYMLMPQILPLLTLTLVHTWYEESTPPPMFASKTLFMIFSVTYYMHCYNYLLKISIFTNKGQIGCLDIRNHHHFYLIKYIKDASIRNA